MCDKCGCGDTRVVPVDLHERILEANERQARHNREHFARNGILAVNLMGSPGSGKTAVLEATARAMRTLGRLGALTGDLATDNDAQRLRAAGIPSLTITTGSACHLDADLVHHALHNAPWGSDLDYLFIENVGNLVCPAVYDLGEALNVVALSVTEGEDKPLKYPAMFRKADLVLLTKVDLLPHVTAPLSAFEDAVARVAPAPRVLPVSAVTDWGVADWAGWLRARRAACVGETALV
ncbi:MAG: hydrogenase nickel incorporation protein HypB [Acidobacteria bacterium]|nr:hydrogenase nickel incorporation protein HypB [Acidobacteriota bacterium]